MKCKKCSVADANPGKDLCGSCYKQLLHPHSHSYAHPHGHSHRKCKGASCKNNANPGKDLCGDCYKKLKSGKNTTVCKICGKNGCSCLSLIKSNTHLLVVLTDIKKKMDMTEKFLYSWKKYADKKAAILGIFQNINPVLRKKFQEYKKKTGSHKLMRWHGTAQKCNLFNTQKFCGDSCCAVCNICKEGFRIDLCGKNTGWSRFGQAIYTAPEASKSHDYNAASEKNGIRTILLCQVAPGKIFQTKINMPTITAPPIGFDAVEGVPGADLNYPELCTYKNESVYPAYVIFYRLF